MQITHKRLGQITIKRNSKAKRVTVRYDSRHGIVVTCPRLTPTLYIRHILDGSAVKIEAMRDSIIPELDLRDGAPVDNRRTLRISSGRAYSYHTDESVMTVTIPPKASVDSATTRDFITDSIQKVWRHDARIYLPKRLKILADRHGFNYQKVRFTHASTRWGSCSSKGTISLNIALMRLPLEIIDYVLVHELCHTTEMNHSATFWARVSAILPNYKTLRKELKSYRTAV